MFGFIFGAVVDPALVGRVKITVIATGFGGVGTHARPSGSTAHTPVDMTPFNEAARALYARVGFTEDGVRRGYYQDGQDALLLRVAVDAR